MATQKQAKTYTTPDGQQVSSKHLRKIDKKRHEAALKFFKKAEALQSKIAEFKAELIKVSDKLNDEFMADYNVKARENARGGYTLSTIDKAIQIEFAVGSRISFDDRIDVAKAKFFEYIDEITDGTVPEIRTLVAASFETTRGKLDVKKVLQLLTYNIEHKTWKAACEILTQSMSSNLTKRYINIRKKDAEGKYKNVIIDLNAL